MQPIFSVFFPSRLSGEPFALMCFLLKEITHFCHSDFRSLFFGEDDPAGVSFVWFAGKVAVGMRSGKPTNRTASANRDARATQLCSGNSHIAMKQGCRCG